MDFNDFNSRMDRMYHAVNLLIDTNVQSNVRKINTSANFEEGGQRKIVISFGMDFNQKGSTDSLNLALFAVDRIISLKDHLKNKIEIAGNSKQAVEDLINNSVNLSIALDIWNSDKHGTPLKSPRTDLGPFIRNLRRTLEISGNQAMIFSPFTGVVETHGNPRIKVQGEIADMNGNTIMSLSDFLSSILSELEDFINKRDEFNACS